MNVLLNDPHPYLPAGHNPLPQPTSDFQGTNSDFFSRRDSSGLGQTQPEQRTSTVYKSTFEAELAQENFDPNAKSGRRSANYQPDQPLRTDNDEVLNLKEREISRLQENNKRLEAQLSEMRVGLDF